MAWRSHVETKMFNINEGIDLQSIDIKSLTNEQLMALKQHLIRKAHIERSKAIGAMFVRLRPSRIDWRKAIVRASAITQLATVVLAPSGADAKSNHGPTVKGG